MSNQQQHIDVGLVRRLIVNQFPQWADYSISQVLPGGWDNRTFRLGDQLAVRLPSAACYAVQVEKEHRWLPFLASQLPLPISCPIALGQPGEGYPWLWSVFTWLAGETAEPERIADLVVFAQHLGHFLARLHLIDASGGPVAGAHSFYRGGALRVYDAETQQALGLLAGKVDVQRAAAIWQSALASNWQREPVWIHGDIAVGNMLVQNGNLSAVIDFGTMAVGDPASDLVIAWTLFEGPSREAFFTAVPVDAATWQRAKGWALWKALRTCAGLPGADPRAVDASWRVLREVLGSR